MQCVYLQMEGKTKSPSAENLCLCVYVLIFVFLNRMRRVGLKNLLLCVCFCLIFCVFRLTLQIWLEELDTHTCMRNNNSNTLS